TWTCPRSCESRWTRVVSKEHRTVPRTGASVRERKRPPQDEAGVFISMLRFGLRFAKRNRAGRNLDRFGAVRFGRAHSLHHGAGPDATGADPEPLRAPVHDRANGLEVDLPPALRDVVRVAHVLSVLQALAADVARPGHHSSEKRVSRKEYRKPGRPARGNRRV